MKGLKINKHFNSFFFFLIPKIIKHSKQLSIDDNEKKFVKLDFKKNFGFTEKIENSDILEISGGYSYNCFLTQFGTVYVSGRIAEEDELVAFRKIETGDEKIIKMA
jgi:hypothetical protein